MKKIISLLLFTSFLIPLSAQSGSRANLLEDLESKQGSDQPALQQESNTATLKSAARLFGAKDDLTSVIMIIPSGSKVVVIDSDSSYYKVRYEDNEGFVLKRQAEIDKQPSAQQELQNEVPVERLQPAKQQQSRFSYLENKYGTSLAARLSAGKIWRGMSAEMVKDSWGSPQKITRKINGNNIKEEWVYRNTWLYFQDNTLMDWGPANR